MLLSSSEGAILGLEYSERCEILADVLGIATRSGFPVIFTQLEQVASIK